MPRKTRTPPPFYISMIFHTKMENTLKGLFFNHSLKRWHFEELVRISGMSRERVSYFLKILQKEQLIIRIKPKGKMPYYEANRTSSTFRSEKRWYGLAMIAHSGLLEHLSQLPEIKTAILFGSFARGDWSASSDIDLFLYGRDANFEKG